MAKPDSQDLLFAYRVRNARTDAGMGLDILARAGGVTTKRMRKIEDGKIAMTMGELRLFADKLKTTPEVLGRTLAERHVPADKEGNPL
jgi:ribosome-binding protein aMBF1 (putative translation factor)